MKVKRLLVILSCIAMAWMMCACGNTENTENETVSKEADYHRAFEMGYVDEKYKSYALDRRVSSQEYNKMLKDMLVDFECDDLAWYEEKVSTYDIPLTRCGAITMSYYAAVCMGADNYNNNFNNEMAEADGQFWETGEVDFEKLFPDCFADIPVEMNEQTWANEFTASFLWNIWHSSPYSGQQTVPFDQEAGGMRNTDHLTMEEAVCAVTRLADSFGKEVYVSIDDEAVQQMDATIWTEELAKKAEASTIDSIEQLPRLTGFVLNGAYSGYHTDTVDKSETDIKNIADWGFSSARFQMRYEVVFSEDCDMINMTQLKKLDKMVASAVENDIHLNLLLCTLPGRTIWTDMSNYTSGGEFDLFINEQQQEKAKLVWQTLARRYQDVPGKYLSFTPFWEADGAELSTGAEAPEYTMDDVCRVLDRITGDIREIDPDRFIIYEPTADNSEFKTIKDSEQCYEMMSSKYENTLISYNFCQNAYVFAEMTAADGENIDHNNHGMFKPQYPVIIYAAKSQINSGEEIIIDGCLPKGTTMELHLKSMNGDGSFIISTEKETLHTEVLTPGSFETGYKLSRFFPFAESDKKIVITLDEESECIRLACENGEVEWSGMNIILPEEYAVDRWYMNSPYDVYLEGKDETQKEGFELKSTSTVMICPNSVEDGKHITIHEDVTFSSEKVWMQANEESIQAWGKAMHDFSPQCVVRIEDACFTLGTTQDALLRYYEDVLTMFDQYSMGWYSNDYDIILGDSVFRLADARVEQRGIYPEFNNEILELLQKHQ